VSDGDQSARRIGVISDTHDLLRPEALRALDGSDLILHAGDICGPDVLRSLREIAPGSAGPRRFTLPVSLGRLDVTGDRVRATLVDLGRRRDARRAIIAP
jgi:calcineurin-like phosphoesterase family protein